MRWRERGRHDVIELAFIGGDVHFLGHGARKGAKVSVTSSSGVWRKVTGKKTGWVYSAYPQ
ncbi:hypothetical protein ACWPKO_24220 (plasmid) [Coraliomargarita sp. W4R53]